jgi:hypothetical protein
MQMERCRFWLLMVVLVLGSNLSQATETTTRNVDGYIYSYELGDPERGHKNAVRINGRTLFKGSYRKNPIDNETDAEDETSTYSLLSLVGNTASVFHHNAQLVAGGGRILHSFDFVTKRLNSDGTVQTVGLTDFFALDEIVSALLHDPYMQTNLPGLDGATLKRRLTGEFESEDPLAWSYLKPALLESFSFSRVENRQIVIRLFLPQSSNMGPGELLWIYLTPSKQLLEAVTAAEKAGLLFPSEWDDL